MGYGQNRRVHKQSSKAPGFEIGDNTLANEFEEYEREKFSDDGRYDPVLSRDEFCQDYFPKDPNEGARRLRVANECRSLRTIRTRLLLFEPNPQRLSRWTKHVMTTGVQETSRTWTGANCCESICKAFGWATKEVTMSPTFNRTRHVVKSVGRRGHTIEDWAWKQFFFRHVHDINTMPHRFQGTAVDFMNMFRTRPALQRRAASYVYSLFGDHALDGVIYVRRPQGG